MKFHIPQDGEQRTIRRFAFLPISDGEDTYWLEWVDITQVYDGAEGEVSRWINTFALGDTDKREAR